jgi:hypothetical protein
MSQSERVRTRIQTPDERLTRLRVEKNRLLARANQSERKRDTRRKILIGGAVLAAIEHEGLPAMRSKSYLRRWLDARLIRPHDRAVFDLTARRARFRRPWRPSSDRRRSRTSARRDEAVGPAPRHAAAVPEADLGPQRALL